MHICIYSTNIKTNLSSAIFFFIQNCKNGLSVFWNLALQLALQSNEHKCFCSLSYFSLSVKCSINSK